MESADFIRPDTYLTIMIQCSNVFAMQCISRCLSNSDIWCHIGSKTKNVVRYVSILQLNSVSCEERECGCGTISNFVSQTEAIPLLLRSNVIKIMGPLMMDSNMSVRCAAVGAFRSASLKIYITGKHSSRIRTARLLTGDGVVLSGGGVLLKWGWGCCLEEGCCSGGGGALRWGDRQV